MSASEHIYDMAVRAAVPLLRAASPFSSRLRRGIAGRVASRDSLRQWASESRQRSRPLLWLHAPSVGEALMAQAILAECRNVMPGIQSIFTYFSPSAERMASRVGADWSGYLPWDRADDVRDALHAAQPACVAFVRTEIWPVLVREAAQRGSAVLMVNGVLSPDSGRLRGAGRFLLGPPYRSLDAIGVVSSDDAECFARLGVRPERVHVTGDARFDQVWTKVQSIDSGRPLLRPFRNREWLVAGSTWPADEEVLIPALRKLRMPAVIAPHDPDPAHITRLEERLGAAGLRCVRLPHEDAATQVDADVVVVDRVGVLADLYAIASLAYVGGGFGSAGLHSVVEPAALGVPVIYGPRHGNAREAARLQRAGGGFIVHDAAELERALHTLATDASTRARAGSAALRFVEQHRGGAGASAALIAAAMAR